jgi:hypothetical protein
LHTKPQIPLVQVAVAFAGGTHGVHEEPHELTLELLEQLDPQAWKPPLHVKPHDTPLQVDVPFAGAGHGVHELPHDAVLVLRAQFDPHA